MGLPYENTSSGDKAIAECQKILRAFGCTKFGSWTDDIEQTLMIQFECRGRMVSVKASAKGYAAAWLRENPHTSRRKGTLAQHQAKAMEVANIAIYSILRDWIKGQITAIETDILTFEGAFLGQILLPNGQTVLEQVRANKLLPPPGEQHE